jgi:hypothetical protein
MPTDLLRAFRRSVLCSFLAVGLTGVPGTAVCTATLFTERAAQTPVDLGAADSFSVLAGTTVTNTGATVIGLDLGLSPGSAVTGFPPGTVSGTVHAADAAAAQAQADLTAAYDDAAARTPSTTVAGDIGGQTLTPGVYNSTSSLGITGTLTLDGQGDPNAVFIIQMGSTLTTASASTVNLINGAQACNVFWQVGSSATLGTNSTLRGDILALTSITVTTGVRIIGRALARNGAVTLDTNDIAGGTCAPGALTISVPASRSLGTGAPATTVTFTLGNVTVDDLRGANPAAWTATVSSTDFTATGVPSIPAGAVTYTPNAEVSHVGNGTFTAGTAGTLSSSTRTAYVHTGGTGSNQLIWNPTLTVAVPNTATATTYTGTIMHSVA